MALMESKAHGELTRASLLLDMDILDCTDSISKQCAKGETVDVENAKMDDSVLHINSTCDIRVHM